jgi:hypothetical protein
MMPIIMSKISGDFFEKKISAKFSHRPHKIIAEFGQEFVATAKVEDLLLKCPR